MPDRPLFWVGGSLGAVRSFPIDARRQAGYQLARLQAGLLPDDWKPVRTIGPGVQEIRVHAGEEYRVVYIARFAEGVYVLHAFQKKSQKIPTSDLKLATERYRDLMQYRRKTTEPQ